MATGKLADLMAANLAEAPATEPKVAKPRAPKIQRPKNVVQLPTDGASRAAEPPTKPKPVEIERVTLYLPKPVYKYLKQLALELDVSRTHDLLIEGVEMVLAKHGKSISAITQGNE